RQTSAVHLEGVRAIATARTHILVIHLADLATRQRARTDTDGRTGHIDRVGPATSATIAIRRRDGEGVAPGCGRYARDRRMRIVLRRERQARRQGAAGYRE